MTTAEAGKKSVETQTENK